jgi:hypothetical protein
MRRLPSWPLWLLGSVIIISGIVSFSLARLRTRDAAIRDRDAQIAALEGQISDRDAQIAERDGWLLESEIQLGQAHFYAINALFIAITDLDRLATDADAAAQTHALSDTTHLLRATSEHAFITGDLFALALGRRTPDAAEGFLQILRDYGRLARTIADRLDAQGEIRAADQNEIRLLQEDLRLFNRFTEDRGWVGDPSQLAHPIIQLCTLMHLNGVDGNKLAIDSATRAACAGR